MRHLSLPLQVQSLCESPAESEGTMSASLVGGRVISLTQDAFRNMTSQEIVQIYQIYVNELAQHVTVLAREGAAHDVAATEVERLSQELVSAPALHESHW